MTKMFASYGIVMNVFPLNNIFFFGRHGKAHLSLDALNRNGRPKWPTAYVSCACSCKRGYCRVEAKLLFNNFASSEKACST
jgi:hypothetical protein